MSPKLENMDRLLGTVSGLVYRADTALAQTSVASRFKERTQLGEIPQVSQKELEQRGARQIKVRRVLV